MQSKKRKLLFVINSLGCGGAEKSLVSLLLLIDYDKYEVYLQMFNKEGMFRELLPKEVEVLPSIDFFEFCKRNIKKQIVARNFKYLKARMHLFIELRKNNKKRGLHDAQVFWKTCASAIDGNSDYYDIAIAWGQGNPTHYVVEKVNAYKKIAWINADYEAVGHNKEFDRVFYKDYDRIISVSDKLLEMSKRVFPEFANKMQRIEDIQNNELITKMAEKEEECCRDKNKWRLVTVGRLVTPKGYDIAIEACRNLYEKGINFEWLIIGEGPERNFIEKKIKEYGLQESLLLLGAKSNPYPYIKSADIYVQTSKYEGYCLTVAEARTLNIPVVTTNFEVVYSQMINEKNGLIVDMTGEAIAAGVIRLMKDSELWQSIIQYLKNEKKGNIEEIQKFYDLIEG